ATQWVSRTRDLSRRLDVTGRDETSRLASSLNTMMAALERSLRAQRQLVADASHELRTPLTSLRTNLEVLLRSPALESSERDALLSDLVEQLGELGVLVTDLADLAREEAPAESVEDVDLAEIVAEVASRSRRVTGVEIRADLQEAPVQGDASRLARAAANLVDNAVKWSPAGSAVEVRTSLEGPWALLSVADHGPGIPAGDLPFVFDRFYRARSSRGLPGSGLGLAIVRQVAEFHDGRVEASAGPGGGALFRLWLPAHPRPARGREE
ncbi:MAG: HAMP domain-containing sensor histidine kinase, partial [Acidimicrobiales bacterium]